VAAPPPRIPFVADDSDDPVLAELFAPYRDVGDAVPELYLTLGNAPPMLRAWMQMGRALRTETKTSDRLRQLIIMRVAQLTDAEVEWHVHWDMALAAGVTADQISALHDWRHANVFDERERAVLAFTDEITVDVEVQEPAFNGLASHFDAGAIVELTFTAAFYCLVSRVLRTLRTGPAILDAARLAVMRGPTGQ
jgi:alkylhydroperoxidase family enzyme